MFGIDYGYYFILYSGLEHENLEKWQEHCLNGIWQFQFLPNKRLTTDITRTAFLDSPLSVYEQ